MRRGPEAFAADRVIADLRTLAKLPELVRRLEARFLPPPGGAPPPLPLAQVEIVGLKVGWRYAAVAVLAGVAGVGATLLVAG